MNLYQLIDADVRPFCEAHGLPVQAMRFRDEKPPRYLIFDIISDPDSSFYENRRHASKLRVQFDFVVQADLEQELTSFPPLLEEHLIGCGYLPQGNGRVRFDKDTNLAYWQKDYFKKVRR